MRTLALGLALLGAVAAPAFLTTQPAAAAPEPEPIPRRWEFRVDAGPLRVATVDVPGEGPKAYLFMTIRVINNTGVDRDFAPSFELATDTGLLLRSGRGVPFSVVQELLRRIDHPFLEDEISIQGRILQGEEHAKEGLIVWPAADLSASEYTVFATGLSGETKAITRPDTGQEYVLRKTLMLVHAGTGTLDPTSGRPVPRVQERWILR